MSVLLAGILLASCVTSRGPLPSRDAPWQDFVVQAEGLSPDELEQLEERTAQALQGRGSQWDRLKLAYLLSRIDPAPESTEAEDLDAARSLLEEVPEEHRYRAFRLVIDDRLSRAGALTASRTETGKLARDLEAVTGEQRRLRRQFDALRVDYEELRAEHSLLQEQLESLKAIETRMSEGQEALPAPAREPEKP